MLYQTGGVYSLGTIQKMLALMNEKYNLNDDWKVIGQFIDYPTRSVLQSLIIKSRSFIDLRPKNTQYMLGIASC